VRTRFLERFASLSLCWLSRLPRLLPDKSRIYAEISEIGCAERYQMDTYGAEMFDHWAIFIPLNERKLKVPGGTPSGLRPSRLGPVQRGAAHSIAGAVSASPWLWCFHDADVYKQVRKQKFARPVESDLIDQAMTIVLLVIRPVCADDSVGLRDFNLDFVFHASPQNVGGDRQRTYLLLAAPIIHHGL